MIQRLLFICILGTLSSCQNDPLPKPIGYFRIDLPKKEFSPIDSIPFPFTFQLPQYAKVNLSRTAQQPNFLNVDFNRFGARIHMSYIPVDGNLRKLLEDSRSLVYKHTVKAQEISENVVINDEENVYGNYYQIEGNAASGSQFYLTDSSDHFVRGALYFNVSPNFDSIAPVLSFVKQDIERMIESFEWKTN